MIIITELTEESMSEPHKDSTWWPWNWPFYLEFIIVVGHKLCGWKDSTWQVEAMMWIILVWGNNADDSQANSYEQQKKKHGNSSSLGLLGKAYRMTLIVIVGDYIAFISKTSVRRIDETNIAAFKLYVASWLCIYRCIHHST